MDETRLQRYAELAVRVGANVQPGQDLGIEAYVEHAPFARALVRAGYDAGARHVEVFYADQHVQLARLQLAAEDTLGWVPEWQLERLRSPAERGGAAVFGPGAVANVPTEEVFTTPDPARPQGVVRSTRPLAIGGATVVGLEMRFEGGEIVEVRAESGAELVEAQLAKDAGAKRLGEGAIVDGTSRVGET